MDWVTFRSKHHRPPRWRDYLEHADYGAVIHPTIGIVDRLGHQHVLSISPPDESIVQQLTAPRPKVHPRGVIPRQEAKEGVGQQETVLCTRSQKKEAVIVTTTKTVGTQPSLPGSVVCPDAGVEVTKDNYIICLRYIRQEGLQVLVEFVLRRIRAHH
ncbi:unnamed protein product [Schistocephalus solidus]|uniref:Transposase n=1 Tax=Schistocephalus solidus TaxID=70667 RepID=A0A183SZN5_SCHSO|nr:unnamed protein product [Schistocephalus solidus]